MSIARSKLKVSPRSVMSNPCCPYRRLSIVIDVVMAAEMREVRRTRLVVLPTTLLSACLHGIHMHLT